MYSRQWFQSPRINPDAQKRLNVPFKSCCIMATCSKRASEELRIEAFTIAVLPWTAWLDVGGLGSNGCNSLADGLGDELRAIV
jgi:hypothetical protein